MFRRLWPILLAAFALAGCFGDDDSDENGGAGADYAAEIERLSDDAYAATQDALVALNEVADGSTTADEAIGRLEVSSRRVSEVGADLGERTPPEGAETAADDLEFLLGKLARDLDFAATDVRVASRRELGDAGLANARVVLASQSGIAALARALGNLARASD